MQKQCNNLSYRIYFIFLWLWACYRNWWNGHSDRNIGYEIKETKSNTTRT